MKIKSENFWENIGEIIYVPMNIKWDGDDETINLKAGTYQIVEIKEHGNLFLDIKNNDLSHLSDDFKRFLAESYPKCPFYPDNLADVPGSFFGTEKPMIVLIRCLFFFK